MVTSFSTVKQKWLLDIMVVESGEALAAEVLFRSLFGLSVMSQ